MRYERTLATHYAVLKGRLDGQDDDARWAALERAALSYVATALHTLAMLAVVRGDTAVSATPFEGLFENPVEWARTRRIEHAAGLPAGALNARKDRHDG